MVTNAATDVVTSTKYLDDFLSTPFLLDASIWTILLRRFSVLRMRRLGEDASPEGLIASFRTRVVAEQVL